MLNAKVKWFIEMSGDKMSKAKKMVLDFRKLQ